MMTTRQSALYAILLGGLVLGSLAGCSAGNPNMSAAESAMEQQNYERALANVDTAIIQDSANVEAHLMRARILRQMADSTTPPERYKELYQQARQSEEQAIEFDPARRSEVKTQRRLAYIQEFQRGAQAFTKARKSGNRDDYLMAAAYFGAAGAIHPDSTGPILNEAYARLNAAQLAEGEEASEGMSKVIPILEQYLEKADQPSKDAYTILTQLYLQANQPEEAIDLSRRALDDLSSRSTHIRLAGTSGVNYTGTVEAGGSSREVEGTVPDRIEVSASDGVVSGTFQKSEKQKGQLRATLFVQGTRMASDQVQAPGESLSLSQDLAEVGDPLGELRNYRLNAFNQTGETERAMKLYRKQIERDPSNATYQYNYGSLLLQADRFDEAAEHLSEAVELDPSDPKKQYNLGAAYLNKGVVMQDSLVAVRDSVMEQDRNPTEEETEKIRELNRLRNQLFMEAIPPLERARQLSDSGDQYHRQSCSALFRAYVQTEQQEKAEQVQDCAGMDGEETPGSGGSGSGGGGFGSQ